MKPLDVASLRALLLRCASGTVGAQHPRLDRPLSDLVDSLKIPKPAAVPDSAAAPAVRALLTGVLDAGGRVLVDIMLDGSVLIDDFAQRLTAAGGTITGLHLQFRSGAIPAFVPSAQIAPLSAGSGLHLMKMTLRPRRYAGVATSPNPVLRRRLRRRSRVCRQRAPLAHRACVPGRCDCR